MQIVPQQSRIIVEPIEEADSQLVIPNSKTEDGEDLVFKRLRVVAVGTGRVLDTGVVIDMPMAVGDEVVVDGRYCKQLQPRTWYGDRELYVVDYAGVLVKVVRDPAEPISTHKPAKPAILAPSKKILVAS